MQVAGRLQITHGYAIKVCSKVYTFVKRICEILWSCHKILKGHGHDKNLKFFHFLLSIEWFT